MREAGPKNEDNLVGSLLSGGLSAVTLPLTVTAPLLASSLLSDCSVHPLTPPRLYCACMLSSFITPTRASCPLHRIVSLAAAAPTSALPLPS
jgi:hypothetical protein